MNNRYVAPTLNLCIAALACFDATQPILDGLDPAVLWVGQDPGFVNLVSESGTVAGFWMDSTIIGSFAGDAGGPNTLQHDQDATVWPASINDAGWVVGDVVLLDGRNQAFLWRGSAVELLDSDGFLATGARDINNAGLVVGYAMSEDSVRFAATWIDGNLALLDTQNRAGQAGLVNEQGDIVGSLEAPFEIPVPFRYSGGIVTELTPLPGKASAAAVDLNERGQVVGISCGEGVDCRATLWDGAVAVDLGTLGGARSFAAAINTQGAVAGTTLNSEGELRGFYWINGRMTDLGTFEGSTVVTDLSDAGAVVGASDLRGTSHAFHWQDGHLAILKTLGSPGSFAWGLNEAGIVVGRTGIEGSEKWFPVVWRIP